MKKLKLILAAFALCFSTLSVSATETDPNPNEEALRGEIVTLLGEEVPDYLLQDEELKTNVSFMLNNKNEIIVMSVNTESNVIDTYIKSKLNYKTVNVKGLQKGEVYKVPLIIRQS